MGTAVVAAEMDDWVYVPEINSYKNRWQKLVIPKGDLTRIANLTGGFNEHETAANNKMLNDIAMRKIKRAGSGRK